MNIALRFLVTLAFGSCVIICSLGMSPLIFLSASAISIQIFLTDGVCPTNKLSCTDWLWILIKLTMAWSGRSFFSWFFFLLSGSSFVVEYSQDWLLFWRFCFSYATAALVTTSAWYPNCRGIFQFISQTCIWDLVVTSPCRPQHAPPQ